jgi:hypothetical protein
MGLASRITDAYPGEMRIGGKAHSMPPPLTSRSPSRILCGGTAVILFAGRDCQMIARQPFGRTGHASSRIIFGAYALSNAAEADGERILGVLPEHGVNHIDTAPMYGNAEKIIGPWMNKHRDDFFLATKSRSRTYEGAWTNLRHSLDYLRVDRIDLWQLHGLTNQTGWEKAMGTGGALEAFVERERRDSCDTWELQGTGTRWLECT